MDPDMNKYDLEHVVTGHPRMTTEEWEDIYRDAWEVYYTPEHIETILRRAAACGIGVARSRRALSFFFSRCVASRTCIRCRAAFSACKYRLDRRPGLPIEPAWIFYPK